MTRKQISALIFHKDTMALIASLVSLWFTIGLIIDANYDQKDLIPHTGQLVQIDSVITKVKDKPLFKEVTKELRLTLNTEEKYFTSITTKGFGNITSQIAIGDTVVIFTKPKAWGIFGIKKSNGISHFIKGNITIIDFEAYKQSISGLFVITLLASLSFFILYYVRTRKRYIFNISNNP